MSKPTLPSTTRTVAELIEAGEVDLVVYTKPSCVQCFATYRAAERGGLRAVAIDVSDEGGMTDEQRAEFEALTKANGYMQAPVVVDASGRSWSGFQPDLIAAARG